MDFVLRRFLENAKEFVLGRLGGKRKDQIVGMWEGGKVREGHMNQAGERKEGRKEWDDDGWGGEMGLLVALSIAVSRTW